MKYSVQNFEKGDVLTADHLNHIETGIVENSPIYKLHGKKLSIIGDSISTFKGYIPSGYATFYPMGDLTSVENTWWNKLINETGLTLLKNCAWSGSKCSGNATSTTSAAAGCSTKRVNDLADGDTKPDIIICYIGINDFGTNTDTPVPVGDWNSTKEIPSETNSVSTFSEAYAIMVDKVMRTYPEARVFCCTLLHNGATIRDTDSPGVYPTKNANGTTLEDYNKVIRDVANGLGADIIEVTKCGINFYNFDKYTVIRNGSYDSTHPNVAGAELVKRKILAELIAKY